MLQTDYLAHGEPFCSLNIWTFLEIPSHLPRSCRIRIYHCHDIISKRYHFIWFSQFLSVANNITLVEAFIVRFIVFRENHLLHIFFFFNHLSTVLVTHTRSPTRLNCDTAQYENQTYINKTILSHSQTFLLHVSWSRGLILSSWLRWYDKGKKDNSLSTLLPFW